MMQVIRDKAQGVVSWVIVGVITLVFCSWGVSSYLDNNASPTVAKVDGVAIGSHEIDDLYNHWVRHNSNDKNFDISQIDPKIIKQQLVRSMAQERAVVQGLQNAGLAISDRYLISVIQQQPNLQQDGKFSIDLYKLLLKQNNVDEAAFEKVQADSLMLTQAQQGIIASSFILDNELSEIAKIRNQKRDIGYVIIPTANFQKGIDVTEEQIAKLYAKHSDSFVEPQQVKLQYIELSIDDIMKNETIDDQKLREYYKTNAQLFGTPELLQVRHIMIEVPSNAPAKQQAIAKEKIDAVYKKLQNGASFVTLAKQDSEDKLTSNKGGDLGWVSKTDGDIPPTVFSLKKSGDFTAPVQTDFGWHIFELSARKGGETKPYDEVKNVVIARYKRETAERLFSAAGEELANLSFENQNSLEPASEKLKLPIQTTDYFKKMSGVGLASSKNVRNAAFSDTVLEEGHNSDLIRISDDSYVVIRVADVKPERKLQMDEVRKDLVTMLQKQGAAAKAKAEGEAILKEVKENGASIQSAVARRHLQWSVVKDAARDSREIPTPILQQAFILDKPTQDNSMPIIGFTVSNGNFAITAVTKVTPGVFDEKVEQITTEKLKQQVSLIKGRFEYESLQAALIDKAKIKYYEPK